MTTAACSRAPSSVGWSCHESVRWAEDELRNRTQPSPASKNVLKINKQCHSHIIWILDLCCSTWGEPRDLLSLQGLPKDNILAHPSSTWGHSKAVVLGIGGKKKDSLLIAIGTNCSNKTVVWRSHNHNRRLKRMLQILLQSPQYIDRLLVRCCIPHIRSGLRWHSTPGRNNLGQSALS